MAYGAKDYSKLIGMGGFSETLLKNHFTLRNKENRPPLPLYFLKTKRQKSPNQALEWTAESGPRRYAKSSFAAATQLGRWGGDKNKKLSPPNVRRCASAHRALHRRQAGIGANKTKLHLAPNKALERPCIRLHA